MAKKTTKTKTTGDLESRITALEKRLTALEQLSKKVARKKREYTDAQRSAIRARLLAGQEAARKRKDNEAKATVTNKPEPIKTEKSKQAVNTERKQ